MTTAHKLPLSPYKSHQKHKQNFLFWYWNHKKKQMENPVNIHFPFSKLIYYRKHFLFVKDFIFLCFCSQSSKSRRINATLKCFSSSMNVSIKKNPLIQIHKNISQIWKFVFCLYNNATNDWLRGKHISRENLLKNSPKILFVTHFFFLKCYFPVEL